MYTAISNNNNISPVYYYTPNTPTSSSSLVYSNSSSPRDLPISPTTIYTAPTPPIQTSMIDNGMYINPVYAQQQHSEYITSMKPINMQLMSSPVATTAPAMEDVSAVTNMEFNWISATSGPVSISSTAGADSGFVTTPTPDHHYGDFVSYPQQQTQQHYRYETEVTTPSAWISTASSTASFDNSIQTTTGAVPVTELQENHSCGSEHLDDACDNDNYDTHHHTEQAYEWYAPVNQMPLASISNNNNNNNNNCPQITPYPTEAPTSAVPAAGPMSTVPVSQPAGTDDTDGETPMEKKYQCQICGKYFRRDLPRHVRTHQEEGRFTCPFSRDQCPHKRGQFNRPYDFKKHLLHGHFTFDDQKRVRSFRNLRSKLSFPGMCVCGRRFVASEWLDNHVLGGSDRCPMLIGVAADRLARNRHVNENIDQF